MLYGQVSNMLVYKKNRFMNLLSRQEKDGYQHLMLAIVLLFEWPYQSNQLTNANLVNSRYPEWK